MIRISRPCYDKYFRCPGWAGGGLRYAKVQRCDDGHLDHAILARRLWKWRFNRCTACGIVAWPYMIRLADWRWWRAEAWLLPGRIRDWRWERQHYR